LHNQVRPQFEALRDQTDNQIRQILTPDQVSKFNDLVREWRARGLPRRE
jgi:Spy/CpxP family protein refolding chaperone